ncbi:MAG: hypothetical protein WCL39_09880 [Armatimonadota bacterium]
MDSTNEPMVFTYSDAMTRYMKWEAYVIFASYAGLGILLSWVPTWPLPYRLAGVLCYTLLAVPNIRRLGQYPFSITVGSEDVVIQRGEDQTIPVASITSVHRGFRADGWLHFAAVYAVKWQDGERTRMFAFSESLMGADKLYNMLMQYV